ncbi:MAG: DAK2 domain-containing protein [Bacillota bacterium]|jgi:DAK2 domain fusion protein YloV|nr:DAK2 domain-containing protein [Bacillota bacterium]NLM31569.1 DAK2 domain-containing protein [Acholeplasmataceae bacterium]
MQIKKIDGALFKAMVANGAENLKLHYKEVDALNVFPVPDGDTGTNMKLTIDGGVNEIYALNETNLHEVAKKLSRGMLMGARGNSGVILSQLFRGLSKGFEGFAKADAIHLARAFDAGVKQAYKAVMKPVEGTILTVVREATEKLLAISSSRMTINEFFSEFLAEAKASLERTPELLPVLKEAGVIDSGGAGLVYILEGMAEAVEGRFVSERPVKTAMHTVGTRFVSKVENVEFGYCTEFILQLSPEYKDEFEEEMLTKMLTPLGDSIVTVVDEDIVKVHIHTLKPGDILNVGQKFGEYVHLKIENMTIQHNESQVAHAEEGPCECGEEHYQPPRRPEIRKKYAIVVVAAGKGLINAFKEMGADFVVNGGQSMNPSTEDFIRGYDTLNAEHILVFPNNGNVILAASQSAKIYSESKVHVVETKSIAQGFAALTMLDLNGEPEEVIADIMPVIENVTTGLVTYSVRDTEFNGFKIKKNDYIGICDNKIVATGKKALDAVKGLLKEAVTDTKEIITVIYGADVGQREINELVKYIERNYDQLEIDVIEGNQEVYSYILAVE